MNKDHFRSEDLKCEHFDKGEPCPVLSEHACVADKRQGMKAGDVVAFAKKLAEPGMDTAVVLSTAFLTQLSSAPFALRSAFAKRVVDVLTRDNEQGLAAVDYRLRKGMEEQEQKELMDYLARAGISSIDSEKTEPLRKVYPCRTLDCPGDIVWFGVPRNYWACPVCAMHFGSFPQPSATGQGDKHE